MSSSDALVLLSVKISLIINIEMFQHLIADESCMLPNNKILPSWQAMAIDPV